jgi:hypothetical protein
MLPDTKKMAEGMVVAVLEKTHPNRNDDTDKMIVPKTQTPPSAVPV